MKRFTRLKTAKARRAYLLEATWTFRTTAGHCGETGGDVVMLLLWWWWWWWWYQRRTRFLCCIYVSTFVMTGVLPKSCLKPSVVSGTDCRWMFTDLMCLLSIRKEERSSRHERYSLMEAGEHGLLRVSTYICEFQ
jgi:hypothetical protein